MKHLTTAGLLAAVFVLGLWLGLRLRPGSPDSEPASACVPTPRSVRNMAACVAAAERLYRQGDLVEAAAHYQAAVRYDGNDPSLRIKLARVYFADRCVSEAVAQLRAAIELDPACGEAYFELARVFASRGRGALPQAAAAAARAAELGYPVPDAFLHKLEQLRQDNARAKQQGRPGPDQPWSGLGGPPGRLRLPERSAE